MACHTANFLRGHGHSKHCFDIINALTDWEYQALSRRIQNSRPSCLKQKLQALATCFLFFHLSAFCQPQFSSFTELDFVPPAVSLDTSMTAKTGKLTRFYQVKDLGLGNGPSLKYSINQRLAVSSKYRGKVLAATLTDSPIPIKEPGTYFVRFFGKTGQEARACIEVSHSKLLTAKFWKI